VKRIGGSKQDKPWITPKTEQGRFHVLSSYVMAEE